MTPSPLGHMGQRVAQGSLQANNSSPTVATGISNSNRFNPLNSTSRIHSLLSHHDAGPRATLDTTNANIFLQGASTLAGTNTTHPGDHQHPQSQETVIDTTQVQDLSVRQGGLAPTNVWAAIPQELMNRLSLDDNDTALVNLLRSVRPADQWIVSVALLVGNLTRAHLTRAVSPSPREIAPTLEVPHGAFNYTNTIRTFLRRRIRDLLTIGNLEAYSRTHTTAGLPIASTPLLLLSAQLAAQPDEFKEDYLPAGWPGDEVANHSVLGLLRTLLKHERGSLRNILLANIKEFNRRAIDGPVPKLADLILLIDRIMGSRDSLRPAQAILAAYTSTMKVRLAFIRLEVVHHYLNPDPANTLSQWDIIDRRLEFLRRQSLNYKQAYARLVIKIDREVFGDFKIGEIPKDAIALPSATQVQEEITAADNTMVTEDTPNDPLVVDEGVFM
ncbi:hypothetical protein PGTUg99_013472 [Puccinia graminis f. sp. tritici]|uniref:Uncharacterized protein n=1 Tax=Puccinia graminis f. sp. tritici TaxID=56615 RepID=A0A5B0LPG1_PUCGR|nr:hypothetical protein PGTUg99_013472 [Puccinia graminis f. sp. tritici]